MARRHGRVKKFCRFNFVSISWKSNLEVHAARISVAFSRTAEHYVYAPLLFGWMSFSVWSFFFFWFVCVLFTRVRRTQTPRRSWITYSFGSPKLIEFLSPFPFRKATTESKKMMHLPSAPILSSAFSFSSQFNCVTKSQAQIEWYDLLIHSAVVLKISRSARFFSRESKNKTLIWFPRQT